MREGRYKTALRYFATSDLQTINYAREYGEALRLSRHAKDRTAKAELLFKAGLLAREHGMDILGYPREVVKGALKHNAAAGIFAHNHPSGVAEPSRADELLTTSLKQALALVDIKVLDHFIVAGASSLSFAERGLI